MLIYMLLIAMFDKSKVKTCSLIRGAEISISRLATSNKNAFEVVHSHVISLKGRLTMKQTKTILR